MRFVLDTNIVVSALRSRRGSSNALLMQILQGKSVWLCSVPLFCEYEAVLKRPEFLLATGFSASQIDSFLRDIASAIEPVELNFLWRPQLPDPADEMVLETAVNGRANKIVTHNAKDFKMASKRFAIAIASPHSALRELN